MCLMERNNYESYRKFVVSLPYGAYRLLSQEYVNIPPTVRDSPGIDKTFQGSRDLLLRGGWVNSWSYPS